MTENFKDEKFDIVIQAGQSNSDGTGFGDASCPYLPNQDVWYMNGDFTISLATEMVAGNQIQSNYSLSFANAYMANGCLKEGRKILILRTSAGGTGFLDNRWGLKDDLYLRMIQMAKTALELNEDNRLVALLWHQGETDAMFSASYETHYENLSTLVNSARITLGYDDLPFIAGDFTHNWSDENHEICKPVIDAIKDVCKNCANGKFVDTDGLLSNAQDHDCDDTIHFSREALYALGERYFMAFKEAR